MRTLKKFWNLSTTLFLLSITSPWCKFISLSGQVDIGCSQELPSELVSSRWNNRWLVQLLLSWLPGAKHRLISHTTEGKEEIKSR